MKLADTWRICTAWENQWETRAFTQRCPERDLLSLRHRTDPASAGPSTGFGWVLKDKVNSKPCHFQKCKFRTNSWELLPVHWIVLDFFFPSGVQRLSSPIAGRQASAGKANQAEEAERIQNPSPCQGICPGPATVPSWSGQHRLCNLSTPAENNGIFPVLNLANWSSANNSTQPIASVQVIQLWRHSLNLSACLFSGEMAEACHEGLL